MNLGYPILLKLKDYGSGGDNCSYQMCKAPVKSSTNKPTPNVLQAGCPSCRPTNSVRALKGKYTTFLGLAYPQAHPRSSNFVCDH